MPSGPFGISAPAQANPKIPAGISGVRGENQAEDDLENAVGRRLRDADDDALEILKQDLGRYCAVNKVLRRAGSKVEKIWTIHRN